MENDMANATGSQETVLIVEDDRNTAALVAAYLEREGFSAVIVNDGGQALQAAGECNPVFVIQERFHASQRAGKEDGRRQRSLGHRRSDRHRVPERPYTRSDPRTDMEDHDAARAPSRGQELGIGRTVRAWPPSHDGKCVASDHRLSQHIAARRPYGRVAPGRISG